MASSPRCNFVMPATTSASGLATFTNLNISGTIGARTLSFSAAGLSGATSTPISITAGPAAKLTITTQPPSNAASGEVFAPQPVVQLRDDADSLHASASTLLAISPSRLAAVRPCMDSE